jgi:F-type H+-transporting ATPase subunit epsilon
MADKLHFELVSPERLLLSEEVDLVTVPGKEGEFGVMVGHAPLMATLRPGVIDVQTQGQPAQRIFVRSGFAEVTPKGLTILASHAVPMADVDAALLDQEIQNAEEDVADAKTDTARQSAQESLDQLRQLRGALA